MKIKLQFLSLLMLVFFITNCANDKQEQNSDQTKSIEERINEVYAEAEAETAPMMSVQVAKKNTKKVYVHYMPWFYSKEHDGFWGQQWTMTNRNPDLFNQDGTRQIASHYYPLIGPYSSNDSDLQEYHLLLMKLSGIDGVIFDWYGSRNVHDFENIKKSTESFISEVEEVGLKFSIMYEDKTTQYLTDRRVSSGSIAAATADLQYISKRYFPSKNYLTANNKKLVFLFGPNYIDDPADWDLIASGLSFKPTFMTLWKASDRVGDTAYGEFSWIDRNHLETLNGYYEYAKLKNIVTIGGAYPGFNDYYFEGGWRPDTSQDWTIDQNGTQTLEQTLALSNSYPVEFIQLITWNDFGEGTMIEPTKEFGYSSLETIQEFTGVPYGKSELEIPYKLYQLRKKYQDSPRIQRLLDYAYRSIYALKLSKADRVLTIIEEYYGD
ncbi:hypothetical protein FFWV33_08520 [Flavobacterium faecale]|uniref:Glycosyl hydrolase family 99 n=1 Tax=Flavobacterium faecale TaxID=1355330 RepID=A0A2S1LCY5_9FLAO|nr:glycoside hydrolase family 71/99-like protein [Flavobacterium faecale]AWG21571.1 hypothetical protein FFWV33_08520 [Flavobacterium faecale]